MHKGGLLLTQNKIEKSDEEWKKVLTPEQYNVLRQKGTERPFSGNLYYNKEKGIYTCAACGQELFSSDTKFESGTGWQSFYDVISSDKVHWKLRHRNLASQSRTQIWYRKKKAPARRQHMYRSLFPCYNTDCRKKVFLCLSASGHYIAQE